MKPRLHSPWLHYRRSGRSRRAAFSLAELVVAIGILLLMLALAGQVMSLTVRSTGQATALTQINQRLRVLEESLREDLRKIDRERSVMVIQGNPINAYWTQVGKESDVDEDPSNGYPNALGPVYERTLAAGTRSAPAIVPEPPRADILMFFTTRKGRSFVDYKYQDPDLRGTPVTSNLQQVVYGHAELGEWVDDDGDGNWEFDPLFDPNDTHPSFPDWPSTSAFIPAASQWHLARRSVLLVDTDDYPLGVGGPAWPVYPGDRLDSEALLEGAKDVLAGFQYDSYVTRPFSTSAATWIKDWPYYWPEVFYETVPYTRSRLDVTPPPAIADRMGHYLLPNCASFKVEWALDPDSDFLGGLLDLEREVHWIDPGNLGELSDPDDATPLAAIEAARKAAETSASTSAFQALRAQYLQDLLDKRGDTDLAQSGIDPLASTYTFESRFKTDLLAWAPQVSRYGPSDRMATHVFTASRGPGGAFPEEIFPVALRITVDLWDTEGRLDRPVRHVMVLPVGE